MNFVVIILCVLFPISICLTSLRCISYIGGESFCISLEMPCILRWLVDRL